MPDNAEPAEYTAQLATLAPRCQVLCKSLLQAESNRAHRIRLIASGPFGEGIEELANELQVYQTKFAKIATFQSVALILDRVRLDFLSATEAFLCGSHSVVLDLMRSVMEAEYLFSDFASAPASVDSWTTASEQDRRKNYAPARLRERRAARAGKAPRSMTDAREYSLHSRNLHLTVDTLWFAPRGISSDRSEEATMTCLAEILEHGRRMILVTDKLYCSGIERRESSRNLLKDAKKFFAAWEHSQLFLEVFQQLRGDPREDELFPKGQPLDVLKVLRYAEAKRIVQRIKAGASEDDTGEPDATNGDE